MQKSRYQIHASSFEYKKDYDLTYRHRVIGSTEHVSTSYNYALESKPRYSNTGNGDVLTKLFAILIAILLFTNLVAVLRGDTDRGFFTFEQLIESIGNAPLIDLKNIDLTSGIVNDDWGALDFIRLALVGLFDTWFGEFINLLVFLGAGLANAFIFITYFLRIFFAL